ncbi:MAG: hypothetical protein IT292_06245 [Deltaproteobacteria bacterium]|nr:hypothetical protein [Deltaproteobacteria bacterium]
MDAAVYVGTAFDAYDSGVYEDANVNPTTSPCYYSATNHAIALIGWDDNPPEGGDGVWILRNSWGESGYMRIRYNSARVNTSAAFLLYDPTTPVISDVSAAINENGANLGFKINPQGYDSEYIVQYGLTTSYGSSTAVFDAGSGSSDVNATVALSNLLAKTVYHYRVVAANVFGEVYSDDYTFTTSGAKRAPVITSVTADDITSNSVTLTGIIQTMGANTNYYFEYWIGSEAHKQTSTGLISRSLTEAEVTAKPLGLLPNSQYSYRLVATNYVDTVYSQVGTFNPTESLFLDDFSTGTIPNSWTHQMVAKNGSSTPRWQIATDDGYYSMYLNCSSLAANDEVRMMLPQLDLANRRNLYLSFSLEHNASDMLLDYFQLQISTDGTHWTDLGEEIYRYRVGDRSYELYIIDLSSYQESLKIYIGLLEHCQGGPGIKVDGLSVSALSGLFYPDDFPAALGLWNTNYRMINVLELANKTLLRKTIQLKALSKSGTILGSKSVILSPGSQKNIVLNDILLQAHTNETGIIIISGANSEDLAGRITLSRWNSTNTALEYAFSSLLERDNLVHRGNTYLGLNSAQPIKNNVDSSSPVTQWLSVVNLSKSRSKFTLNTYNLTGLKIASSSLYIRPNERKDFAAQISSATSGSIEVIPQYDSTTYVAELIRYGQRAANEQEFSFALPLISSPGDSSQSLLISRGANAENWIEVINTGDNNISTYA